MTRDTKHDRQPIRSTALMRLRTSDWMVPQGQKQAPPLSDSITVGSRLSIWLTVCGRSSFGLSRVKASGRISKLSVL